VHFRYICVLVCGLFTSVFVMPGNKGSALPPLYIAAEEVLAHDAELYEAFANATRWVRASGTPTSAQRAEMRRLILKVQAAALPQTEKKVVTRFLQQASKRRLSAGAAAGIAVGGIATIAALVVAAKMYRQKHKEADGGASEHKTQLPGGLPVVTASAGSGHAPATIFPSSGSPAAVVAGPLVGAGAASVGPAGGGSGTVVQGGVSSDTVADYRDRALGVVVDALPSVLRLPYGKERFERDTTNWNTVFEVYNGAIPFVLQSAVGICEVQGHREEMEDAVGCFEIAPGRFGVGVADGHGRGCAAPLARMVSQKFLRMFNNDVITPQLAREKSIELDERLKTQPGCDTGGTTFTGAVVDVHPDNTVKAITLVNLGDSRCVVFDRSGLVVAQTEDHSPDLVRETVRIEGAGARVVNKRVYALAVSRAFGDFDLDSTKNQISNHAEIVSVDMARRPRWIVIACDGLWDNLAVSDMGRVLSQCSNCSMQELVHFFTYQAYLVSGSKVEDNISTVIIDLNCIGSDAKAKATLGPDADLINAFDSTRRTTPLMRAVLASNELEIQRILTSPAVMINVSDLWPGSYSALHCAALKNYVRGAELLLNAGADINVVNSNSYTPLHVALEEENLEVANYLLSRGARIDAWVRDLAAQNNWKLVNEGGVNSFKESADGGVPLPVVPAKIFFDARHRSGLGNVGMLTSNTFNTLVKSLPVSDLPPALMTALQKTFVEGLHEISGIGRLERASGTFWIIVWRQNVVLFQQTGNTVSSDENVRDSLKGFVTSYGGQLNTATDYTSAPYEIKKLLKLDSEAAPLGGAGAGAGSDDRTASSELVARGLSVSPRLARGELRMSTANPGGAGPEASTSSGAADAAYGPHSPDFWIGWVESAEVPQVPVETFFNEWLKDITGVPLPINRDNFTTYVSKAGSGIGITGGIKVFIREKLSNELHNIRAIGRLNWPGVYTTGLWVFAFDRSFVLLSQSPSRLSFERDSIFLSSILNAKKYEFRYTSDRAIVQKELGLTVGAAGAGFASAVPAPAVEEALPAVDVDSGSAGAGSGVGVEGGVLSDEISDYSDTALGTLGFFTEVQQPYAGRNLIERFSADKNFWKDVFYKYNGAIPGKLRSAVGICEVQGQRPNMEDAVGCFEIAPARFGICVADGHGGSWSRPASSLARIVSQKYLRMFGDKVITAELARKSSIELDATFFRQPSDAKSHGTTFTGAVIDVDNDHNVQLITLINLGDSRCVVFDETGRVVAQTEDHSPDLPREQDRILRNGGSVGPDYNGTVRINNVLSVSRAFGDFSVDETKQQLSNEAEIVILEMPIETPEDSEATSSKPRWIVIGCDGLWDNLTEAAVGDFLLTSSESTVQDLTDLCTRHAYEKSIQGGVKDNISVVIVDLTGIGK
jgi:serine/threonine protein phosphatase PrpC